MLSSLQLLTKESLLSKVSRHCQWQHCQWQSHWQHNAHSTAALNLATKTQGTSPPPAGIDVTCTFKHALRSRLDPISVQVCCRYRLGWGWSCAGRCAWFSLANYDRSALLRRLATLCGTQHLSPDDGTSTLIYTKGRCPGQQI